MRSHLYFSVAVILSFLAGIQSFNCRAYAESSISEKSGQESFRGKLTAEEKSWLEQVGFINICVDPDWLPYENLDKNGVYTGLVADYVKRISALMGKEFRLIRTASWAESLNSARQRKCDILPGSISTMSRSEYMSFSDPYMFLPLVVATSNDELFIIDFDQVVDRSFAIVKDYAAVELLRKKYPDIDIREVDSALTGLKMVQKGKVYGYIDTLLTTSYQIRRNGISGVKISGELNFKYDTAMAVRSDKPLLLSIINKAIASITDGEKQKIFYKWTSYNVEKGFNYSLLWKIIIICLVVIFLLIYRNVIISKYNRKLFETNRKLDALYKTDKLTGVFNRHILDMEIEREILRKRRYKTNCSVILMDIDYFKCVNDTYGHYIGDSVLIEMASIFRNSLRKADIIGRWGGEEFIVVCPESSLFESAHIAEKLRYRIEHYRFSEVNESLTASFGVAAFREDDTNESVIKRVDAALYTSKSRNRNCVTIESDIMDGMREKICVT